MKNKRPLFVAFEGADGCGKSTASKILAAQLGAEWICTPSDKFKEVRKTADAEYKNCGMAAQLFYAASVVHASSLVKTFLEKGKSVVMDRYAASTIVYDKIVRDSGFPDSFWINSVFKDIAIPDITFYLEIGDETRARRMQNRGGMDGTDKSSIRLAKELSARYEDILTKFRGERSWKIVRVGNETTPEECADKCRAIVAAEGLAPPADCAAAKPAS